MGLFGPLGACGINVFRESLFTDPFGRGSEGRLYLCEVICHSFKGRGDCEVEGPLSLVITNDFPVRSASVLCLKYA